jgi:hypothetical protein
VGKGDTMRKIFIILICMVGILAVAAGCGEEPQAPGNGVGQDFRLPISGEAVIKGEDLRITFEEVIEDSRCPLNVECVWQGRARYTVRFTQGETSELIELHEAGLGGQAEENVFDYRVTATLEPYPESPDGILKEDYRLNMTVRKLPQLDIGLEDGAAIYAAVIRQLYEVDHTFGDSPPDFPNLYIVYITTDSIGGEFGAPPEPQVIPERLRSEIGGRLSDLPAEIFWVNDFRAVPLAENSLVEGGGVVIRLGNIHEGEGETVQVAGSIYIANLAGGGKTYVLEKQGGTWRITGTTGPMWIS